MSQQDDQWIEEDTLAELLGVPRPFLKKMRPDMPAGTVDTNRVKAVIWQKSAARNALTAFGLVFDWPEPPPAATPTPPPAKERVTVVCSPPNRRIVTCKRATGALVHVRVVDNRKYLPKGKDGKPMTLEAIKNTLGNWWNLIGPEPRWPGRW